MFVMSSVPFLHLPEVSVFCPVAVLHTPRLDVLGSTSYPSLAIRGSGTVTLKF